MNPSERYFITAAWYLAMAFSLQCDQCERLTNDDAAELHLRQALEEMCDARPGAARLMAKRARLVVSQSRQRCLEGHESDESQPATQVRP